MGPFKWTPSVSIREGFGKTNASAQMLFTSGRQNEPASLFWEEKRKKNCETNLKEKKNVSFSETRKVDVKERGPNLTADCVSRDGDCDSVLYLQCREVQPMGHKTFLTWI